MRRLRRGGTVVRVDAPETVTEAVRLLEAQGYSGDFPIVEAALACPDCGHQHGPSDLVIREVFRFEGPSDPGDEAIVLGVACQECGATGIVVSAYGPDADPVLLELVSAVDGRR